MRSHLNVRRLSAAMGLKRLLAATEVQLKQGPQAWVVAAARPTFVYRTPWGWRLTGKLTLLFSTTCRWVIEKVKLRLG
jgi:hypothetical protein